MSTHHPIFAGQAVEPTAVRKYLEGNSGRGNGRLHTKVRPVDRHHLYR